MISETTATAMDYCRSHLKDLSEDKARHVLFIDMGYSKTSLSLAEIKKTSLKIVYETHNRNLGVRDIDWILYEFYCDMLEK